MPASASPLPNDNKVATAEQSAALVTEKARHNSEFDVLIIGSGAAGLTCALQLKESAPELKLAVVAKGNLSEGNTLYAQGGISAVLEAADSTDSHIADTLDAGAGLCNEEAVRFTVERAPKAVRWLLEHGVTFDRDDEGWHLTKEGGHSHRRVIHSADATGRAVETGLLAHAHRAGFTLLPEHTVVDLITEGEGESKRAVGAYMLHPQGNHVVAVRARAVVLATGGASKVYLYTSNPDGSTGDGVAMAWRAGCRVANMEFMQFHPTCLYHPQAKSFLISEALRGEGAKLRLPDGTRFMPDFDERAELAPRDIVARAIDHEMKRLGVDNVELDISHESPEFIEQHFPTIGSRCKEYGFDLSKSPIPVVPAAHYTCGGVVTDLHGRSDLAGLYVAGESASTGLHGANRLASNSLVECVVFGRAVAKHIAKNIDKIQPVPELPAWDESQVTDSDEEVVVSHNWDELRRFMWDYVGIVRTDKRLARALNRYELLMREIQDYYGNFRVTRDLLELRNLATVAQLIIRSAQQRKESRGLHFTLDYPELLDVAEDTIILPPESVPR